MKSELFKDPFVVLLIVTRAAIYPEDLKRLLTNEAYLIEQRDAQLAKPHAEGQVKDLISIFRNEEWRKNNELSDNLTVSIAKLLTMFNLDKDLNQRLSSEERLEIIRAIGDSYTQIKAVPNALI
ncbi:hypothetical protein GIT51_18935 [Salmonella enterica]|nr:hypothetical protein [Salmonella enterica]